MGVPDLLARPQREEEIMMSTPSAEQQRRKHAHYFKDVSNLETIDVYRVLDLFNVTDQTLGHAIKKLLVAGGRGAGKDFRKDVQEAIDTLQRRLEMLDEDEPKVAIQSGVYITNSTLISGGIQPVQNTTNC